MSSPTISLITVTFNASLTIEKCINSVVKQNYPNLEYIIIDAKSTDATLKIINKYSKYISHFISEPDQGMYDGINKGIRLCSGDIVGLLNADDCFAGDDILKQVAVAFTASGADIIYGDVNYINKKNQVVRKWRAGNYKYGLFNLGWMPPHPSFYVKRQLFKSLGAYRITYGSAADYELMLRYIHTGKVKTYYLEKVMVEMLIGGISNKNTGNRIKAWKNDYKAMQHNGIRFPFLAVFLKPLRKIIQYIK